MARSVASGQPDSARQHERDLQVYAIFDDLALLDHHLLALDPGAFDVLERLVRARYSDVRGVLEALLRRGDDLGHSGNGHVESPRGVGVGRFYQPDGRYTRAAAPPRRSTGPPREFGLAYYLSRAGNPRASVDPRCTPRTTPPVRRQATSRPASSCHASVAAAPTHRNGCSRACSRSSSVGRTGGCRAVRETWWTRTTSSRSRCSAHSCAWNRSNIAAKAHSSPISARSC